MIFALKAATHAQYSSSCSKAFENEENLVEARLFVSEDYDPQDLGEASRSFSDFKFGVEFFLMMARVHRIIYLPKVSDEERKNEIAQLIEFFSSLTMNCLSATETGNMTTTLRRHFQLLLHNLALTGCVFSSYIGTILAEAAEIRAFEDLEAFFEFLHGKVVCFLTHPAVAIDRLHLH